MNTGFCFKVIQFYWLDSLVTAEDADEFLLRELAELTKVEALMTGFPVMTNDLTGEKEFNTKAWDAN